MYGLSKDKPAAQAKWIKKKDLNYRLLCDPESKFIKKWGRGDTGVLTADSGRLSRRTSGYRGSTDPSTKRSHFIFEKGTGKLVDIALGVKPADEWVGGCEADSAPGTCSSSSRRCRYAPFYDTVLFTDYTTARSFTFTDYTTAQIFLLIYNLEARRKREPTTTTTPLNTPAWVYPPWPGEL